MTNSLRIGYLSSSSWSFLYLASLPQAYLSKRILIFIETGITFNFRFISNESLKGVILNENQRATRKLAAGCSKHCFEVVDETDEVSSKHCFEVVDRTDEVSSKHCFEVVDRTDEVSNHTYGKATLTRFEEIFEEYESILFNLDLN